MHQLIQTRRHRIEHRDLQRAIDVKGARSKQEPLIARYLEQVDQPVFTFLNRKHRNARQLNHPSNTSLLLAILLPIACHIQATETVLSILAVQLVPWSHEWLAELNDGVLVEAKFVGDVGSGALVEVGGREFGVQRILILFLWLA